VKQTACCINLINVYVQFHRLELCTSGNARQNVHSICYYVAELENGYTNAYVSSIIPSICGVYFHTHICGV